MCANACCLVFLFNESAQEYKYQRPLDYQNNEGDWQSALLLQRERNSHIQRRREELHLGGSAKETWTSCNVPLCQRTCRICPCAVPCFIDTSGARSTCTSLCVGGVAVKPLLRGLPFQQLSKTLHRRGFLQEGRFLGAVQVARRMKLASPLILDCVFSCLPVGTRH